MKPVRRSDHNFTYLGPAPGVGDLSCRLDQGGTPDEEVVSHWQPSEEELIALNDGGLVELGVLARPLPPVRVGVVAAEPADTRVEDTT